MSDCGDPNCSVCYAEAPDELKAMVPVAAAKLDEMVIGWAAMIDTDRLDMTSGTRCICGQIVATRLEDAGIDDWYRLAREVCDQIDWPTVVFAHVGLRDAWIEQVELRVGAPA